MRCICLSFLLTFLLLTSACQTVPPRPVDLSLITTADRPVDIAPIAAFAAALSEQTEGATLFDTSDGLTLHEARAIALWYSPELRIARLKAQNAREIAAIPGMMDDPVLGVESGRKTTEAGEGGFLREAKSVSRSWISAGSLSITIPISGRVRVERELRRTRHEAALRAAAAAEWQVLSEVNEAWLRWTASRTRVQLLEDHLAVLGAFADTADSLASVGELTRSSARLFTIERMRREADRDREHAAEVHARLNVLHAIGLLPDAPVELLLEMRVAVVSDETSPALEQHPEIARLRAEYEIAEDALRLELRKQYPDITLSPAYSDEQEESSITLGLGFPVPVWNANRKGIAEAAATRDLARLEVETGYERLLADVAQAVAALDGARAVRARFTEGVVPAIDTQIAEAKALLSVGEIEVSFLYDTLTQALETKLEYLNAMLAESLAAARVHFLTAFASAPGAASVETDQ